MVCAVMFVANIGNMIAANKSRGLWASLTTNEKNVFVSWRMRATDAPKTTTYNLYADGKLVNSTKPVPMSPVAILFRRQVLFEVLDANGNVIDSQAG